MQHLLEPKEYISAIRIPHLIECPLTYDFWPVSLWLTMLCATPDSFQFPLRHIDVGGVDDAGIDLDFCGALQALERVVLHQ